jgi:tetratricopeptide (TPR) repeat protein
VQLIDAESGAHLWADRCDANRANLATAQDDIVARLARSLQLEMVEAAARRIEQEKPVDPDTGDFVMRGWAWYYRPFSAENRQEAQRAFERALEIDPQSAEAKIGIATVIIENIVTAASRSPDQDMAQAEQLLLDAMERDRTNPRALRAMGMVRRVQKRLPESKIELDKAMALNGNDPGAMFQLGITLTMLGEPEAALAYFEKRLRLDPLYQNIFFTYSWLGYCHLLLGHADKAIDFLRKARAANPRFSVNIFALAAALGLAGDVNAAKADLAEALELKPEWNTLAKLRAAWSQQTGSPQLVALREKTHDVGLRRAGLPEE